MFLNTVSRFPVSALFIAFPPLFAYVDMIVNKNDTGSRMGFKIYASRSKALAGFKNRWPEPSFEVEFVEVSEDIVTLLGCFQKNMEHQLFMLMM